MFLSSDEFLEEVKAYHKGGGAFGAEDGWLVAVREAHADAYNTVLGTLGGRGFTEAQITGWDRGREFERDIALWLAFRRKLISTDEGNSEFINACNREAELLSVAVTNGGSLVSPGEVVSATPSISGGALSNDSDLFTAPTRYGRYTRNW